MKVTSPIPVLSAAVFGILLLTIGLFAGFHLSNKYWNAIPPVAVDVGNCGIIVDALEEAAVDRAERVKSVLRPHLNICIDTLVNALNVLPAEQKLTASNKLDRISALTTGNPWMADMLSEEASQRLVKYK